MLYVRSTKGFFGQHLYVKTFRIAGIPVIKKRKVYMFTFTVNTPAVSIIYAVLKNGPKYF